MAFPADPLGIRAEMRINGTWTNITSKVRAAGDIIIERGQRNESGSTLTPATARFTLNNRDAYFSNRAPLSVNYGLLPPATPVRFSVDDPDGNALELVNDYDGAANTASTADKSALDITGDIEIRASLKPPAWTSTNTDTGGMTIMSKWQPTGNQRSYALSITYDGKLTFWWSNDGTTINSATSTAAVPFTTSRGAVRVLFDVADGVNKTATFYTSSDIENGPWTQLGSAVTTAGTTSIYSSTADMTIGGLANGGRFTGHRAYFHGRIYRVQVYTGLAATSIRADPNFGAQTAGDDSFSDGLGTPNTWTVPTVIGGITTGTYRFWGEVAELPQRWDSSGTDIYIPTQAADLMRRLTQGEDPVDSALYRYLSSRTDLLSYWPFEEEQGATSLTNTAKKGERGRFNDVTFGAETDLPASKSVLTFNSSASYATSYAVRRGAAAASYSSFVFFFKMPAVPGGNVLVATLGSTGTIQRWEITAGATAWTVEGFDRNGTSVGSQSTSYGSFMSPARWTAVRFQTHISGGYSIVELAWIDIDNQVIAGSTSTTQFPATSNGLLTGFNFPASSGMNGIKLAHVFMGQADLLMVSQFYQAATAYASERAGNRLLRIAEEEGIDLYVIGDADATEQMGAQPIDTFSKIIEECQDVDGGLLYSRPDALALGYRTQFGMMNAEAVTLSYSGNHLSGTVEPTDDDQLLRNDVTVNRPNGASGHAVKETGTRSVAEVGRYRTAYSLNAYSDDRLEVLAQYGVYLGTWDELRYPALEVNLARSVFTSSPALSWAIRCLDVGGVIKLTGLPSWLPPDDVELVVRGWTETLQNRGWVFRWNLQAYGPWRHTNVLGRTAGDYNLASAGSSTLASGVTSSATSLSVATTSGAALWRTGAVSIPIKVGGELMTLTNVAGAASPQTFTVTRSVNGVVKAHSAGAAVNLQKIVYATK